jgi:hypothetical protein
MEGWKWVRRELGSIERNGSGLTKDIHRSPGAAATSSVVESRPTIVYKPRRRRGERRRRLGKDHLDVVSEAQGGRDDVDDMLDYVTIALELAGLFPLLSGLVLLTTGEVHLVEPRKGGVKRTGAQREEQKRR